MLIKFICKTDNVVFRKAKLDGSFENLITEIENFITWYGDIDLAENDVTLGFADLVKFVSDEIGVKIVIE